MENQYKKTFPDLMVGKKIIYVHGFMSAGSSHTVQILRDYMPEATVIAPTSPYILRRQWNYYTTLLIPKSPTLLSVLQWEVCTPRCFMVSTVSA